MFDSSMCVCGSISHSSAHTLFESMCIATGSCAVMKVDIFILLEHAEFSVHDLLMGVVHHAREVERNQVSSCSYDRPSKRVGGDVEAVAETDLEDDDVDVVVEEEVQRKQCEEAEERGHGACGYLSL